MAGLTKKGDVYYAIFSVSGKAKWKRIGKVSFREAKKALKLLEARHDKDRLGLFEIKTTTFDDLSIRYLNFSRANKAFATWVRDNSSIRSLSLFFGANRLELIDNEQVEFYKAKRQGEGVSKRTINIELLCLQSMLKKAIEWRNLSTPPRIEKLTVQKKPPRYLSVSELEHFLKLATPWLLFILIVLRNTGLRSKQLRELKLDDVDFDKNQLTVLNSKGNDYYTITMNNELRITLLYMRDYYVSPQGKIFERMDHQKIYFFCKPDGSPLKSFQTSFKKGVKRAGLKNVTPHVLRHTFASHLVMSGVDLPTVKELMGHKCIITTMIYSHLSNEHKEKAIKKLPWGEKKLKLVNE